MAKQKKPVKKAKAKPVVAKSAIKRSPAKKQPPGKPVGKKAAVPSAAATKSAKAVSSRPAAQTASPVTIKSPGYVSLGRPKVTADEPLFMLFKEDYHARQVFEFLRVRTVHDLEQLAADDIVARLSRPIHDLVARIRERLAEKNRYLAGDEQLLIRYRKQAQANADKE